MKKYYLLMLLTSAIWGFAFIPQRVALEHMGPFTFTGLRFLLGGLVVTLVFRKKFESTLSKTIQYKYGLISGLLLSIAAILQQVGLVYTTAGNAGFLTSLSVPLVPLIGIFIGYKIYLNEWIAVVLAVIGTYLVASIDGLNFNRGDLLEILGAFFWALHTHSLSYFTRSMSSIKLASYQFLVCGIVCTLFALGFEGITIFSIQSGFFPLLYGGLISVGLGYTLQVIILKNSDPTIATLILSLESVFAAFFGYLILNEHMTNHGIIGCFIMFIAVIISQIKTLKSKKSS